MGSATGSRMAKNNMDGQMAMRMNRNLQLTGLGKREASAKYRDLVKGGTQESMVESLAASHSIGDMEPEEATFYSLARPPVEQ